MAQLERLDPPAARGAAGDVRTGPRGEVANGELIEHSRRFAPRVWSPTERLHCAVGYGLANATAVVAPDGLVVVDAGESIEEARDHVAAFRALTRAPARALVYSHSHYVDGARAWLDQAPDGLQVWGHERIPSTRAEVAAEIGPAYRRRACLQFGLFLPREGPDAMPNHGLGPFFFNPNHATRTPGFLELTHPIPAETEVVIAGERFHFIPAEADSEDSLILWLPERGAVINNNVWPALFNVYPLRGEKYRDPLGLVDAIDRIRELDPEHLIGVHGPPISGRSEVRRTLRDYRDAIQYLWDQTVRGINAGLSPDELAWQVRLPERLERAPLNRQFYGAVPHHVRQIHNGLFGWYGTDAAELFPPHPRVEAERIVRGFGGRERVLELARNALDEGDASWSARLAGWLVRAEPEDVDARTAKAAALRALGQQTTSSNVRSVCLTQARELEGLADSLRISARPANERDVLAAPPTRFVRALRVQLDPERSAEVDRVVLWRFTDSDARAGLWVRHGVAEYLEREPERCDLELRLSHATWAALWSGRMSLAQAVAEGQVELKGSLDEAEAFFDLFDQVKLRGPAR